MGIGALAGYGNGYDYRGYSETDNRKSNEFLAGLTAAYENDNTSDACTQSSYEVKSVYELYLDETGNVYDKGNMLNDNNEDWAKTISCRYAKESTQSDPVVEISVIRHGETFTEKVHINDVNPGKCTQQEIKAYLYHYDETNCTQGSYETLMAYAQTAQKQGYWDGNDSFEEFANDTYSWKSMFTDVWTGEASLGLAINRNVENLPEYKIYNAMEHDFVKHIDFDIKNAKLIDMRTNRDKVSTNLADLLPAVPREIVDFLHQNCFSGANVFFEGGGKFLFSDHTFNMILNRIGSQIKADGSYNNIDKAWQSALKIIDEMSSGVENFYGEALGSDTDTQMNVYGMKKLYDSIAEKIKNKIENGGEVDVFNQRALSGFSSYESENYRWEANNEDGMFRIYDKDGNRLGAIKYSDMKIKVDPATGTELLVSEFGTMYDAIPLNAELRKGLSDIIGSDNVETETLSGYTVKRHKGTGLKYIVKDGEEGRGGRTLITSPEEQAAFDKLANEYMAKYPNLVKDAFAAAFYADLEVRGLSGRTDNGIFTMGWDAINFRDDKDYTKNWGMRFNEGGYETLLNWFNGNNHDDRTLQSISSWIRALNGIGYERLASRMEEQQGFFFNY